LWRRQGQHPFYWNNWVVWLGWWLFTFRHLGQSHFHGRCVWPWNRWYPNKDLNTIMKNETILLSPLHFEKPLNGLQVGPNIPIYLFILIDWYYDHTSGYPWPSDTVKSHVSLVHVLVFFFWNFYQGLWFFMFFQSSHAEACLTCAVFADLNKIPDSTPFSIHGSGADFMLFCKKSPNVRFFFEWWNLDFWLLGFSPNILQIFLKNCQTIF